MDKRKLNGGHTTAGRKSKAEEQSLIEKLSPLEEQAFLKLSEAIDGGKDWAIKMFFEYMFGKPKQQMDVTTMGQKIQNVITLGNGINPNETTN
tara:strand:+ start:1038 stop:1316 length:279 start_codon:yes stop_codon:yes gene_type:complete